MDRQDIGFYLVSQPVPDPSEGAPAIEANVEVVEAAPEHYRRLVELTAAVPYTWDLARERFLYVGPQAELMFGYPVRQWFEPGFWHANIHPDDRATINSSIQSRPYNAASWHGEYRFTATQGRVVWVRDSLAFRDTPSGLIGYGIFVDVTDRRIAEEALRESRALLRSLIDAIPATITVKDLAGRYVLVNEAYARNRGRPVDAIIGRTARDLFPVGYAARVEARESIVLQQQSPLESYETTHRHDDGHETTWLASKVPLRDSSGDITHLAGIAFDISDRKKIEEALHAGEKQLRRLVESANVIPYSFDLDRKRFTYVGPQCSRILGYPAEELTDHHSWIARIHPDDRDRAVAESIFGKPEISSYTCEYRMVGANGAIIWLRDYCQIESVSDGRRVEYGFAFDISRQKQAEATLAESEAKYRAIVEDQTELVSRHRPGGVLTFVNRAYARYFGAEPEQLVGTSFRSHLPQEESLRVERHFASLTPEVPVAIIEHRSVLSSGEVRWQQWTDRAFFDADGRVVEYQSVGRDITDKNLAEAQLRDSEQRLRHLVESTDVVPYSWDLTDGKYLYVGPQALKLSGYPAAQWRDAAFWFSILHPDDRTPMEREWLAWQKQPADMQGEYRIIKADGTIAWVRDIIKVERRHDGTCGIYGVMIDITERKKREELLIQAQKMDTIGQMTGGVAHDFNNLLTVIIGNLHLLEPAIGDDSAARRRLDMIKGAAGRGAELTKGLLAFARRQTLQPRRIDVNALVSGMSELLRRSLGEAIRIELYLEPGLCQVEVDPAQLESALVNLAINARDAMPEGGELRIETENRLLEDDHGNMRSHVMLAVRDSGCGMSPEVLGKVFEPFFTTKEVGKGSGLGLSMVYGFVKQSGGRIEITSALQQGTTVRILLPVAVAMRPDAHSDAPPPPTPSAGGETVLVVDEAAALRETAVGILQRLGYRTFEADSGASALSMLQQHDTIDLLLTNVVMPGQMSGVVLAHEAVKRRPRLKVLFASGYAKGDAGAGSQWLSRPYVEAELAGKVRTTLGA